MKRASIDYAIKVRLPITIFVILATFATVYFASRAERYNIGYAPEQPIKYSHKLHAGDMKIDCRYCHTTVDKGRHASVPDVNTCMGCHSVAKTDSPEIMKLTDYFKNKKPIPWERVHKLPEHVYFNHSVHVNKGVSCASCHGPTQNMEVITQVKPFTMTSCLECHRTAHEKMEFSSHDFREEIKKMNLSDGQILNKGPENCFACHR